MKNNTHALGPLLFLVRRQIRFFQKHKGKNLFGAALDRAWIAILVSAASVLPACSWQDQSVSPPSVLSAAASTRPEARARMSLEGAPPVSAASAAAINATLGNVVQTALRGDTAALVNSLSAPDERRIGNFSETDRRSLSQAGRNFSNDWSSRYGKPYGWNSVSEQTQTFQDYQISQGQDSKHAYVVIPASHGMQRMTLSLRDEGNNIWRINAPDSMTQAVLRDRLSRTLSDLDREKDRWPADSSEATRSTAHKVLSIFATA